MIKKIISALALVTIMLTTSFASYNGGGTTESVSFAPISAIIDNKTELESANSLAERKIIKDNSIDPKKYYLDNKVLRQEIALIAKRIAKLETKTKCDNIFSDISATNPNDWACVNIEALVDSNLISKNDSFRPEDNISKSEAVIMLIRAIWFDFTIDSKSSKNWQVQVIEYAAEKWVLEIFTDYNTEATRGWIFKIADTTIKRDEEIKRQIKEKEAKYSDEAM